MVSHVAHRVQALYERGSITYPRSTSRQMTQAVAAACEACAIRWAPVQPDGRSPTTTVPDDAAHAAIVPTLDAIATANLRIPEWMLAPDDVLLHRVVRHAARCVAPIMLDRPVLEGQPDWTRDLDWSRPVDDTPVHLLDALERDPDPGITLYDAEEIAFRSLVAAGLGRPSSIVAHAVHAVERGAVGPRGLTDRGRDILARSPVVLDGEAARTVAERCDASVSVESHELHDALQERVRYASEALGELAPLLVNARRKPLAMNEDAPVPDDGTRLRERTDEWNEANRRAADSVVAAIRDEAGEREPAYENPVPYAVVGMRPTM